MRRTSGWTVLVVLLAALSAPRLGADLVLQGEKEIRARFEKEMRAQATR